MMRFQSLVAAGAGVEARSSRSEADGDREQLGIVSIVSGRKKLFHVATIDSSSTVTIAGRSSGRATCRKVRSSPAPSTRAASSSSSGTASAAYTRMRYTPNGLSSEAG